MTTQNSTDAVKRDVDTATFSELEREEFVRGWEKAGGYTGDYDDSSAPWACPWTHGDTVIMAICGTAEERGSEYWAQCRDEVERLIVEEEQADEIRSEA